MPTGGPTVTLGQEPSELPAAATVTPPVEVSPAAFGLEPPGAPAAPGTLASTSAADTASAAGFTPAAEVPARETASSGEPAPVVEASPFSPIQGAASAGLESMPAATAVPAAAPYPAPGAPVPPPYAPGIPTPEEAGGPAVESGPEPDFGGPNWMLAFVCAWAGATALNEAWAVLAPIGMKAQLLRNPAFLGYGLLGLGLVAFALEALRWGSRRRNVLLAVVVPTLMTLVGVAALVMSQDPGRRI